MKRAGFGDLPRRAEDSTPYRRSVWAIRPQAVLCTPALRDGTATKLRFAAALVFTALLVWLPPVNAQDDFVVSWFTLGGDCGASAESVYSLCGAVGHSDTGQMSGGDYALQAGFGGVVATVVQAPGAPMILAQPVSQTVAPGGDVVLSVNAAGEAPITYQWQFDGADIAGATSNALTLSGVQTVNAGNYTVTVSNRFGALTSSATGIRVPPVLGCRAGTNVLTLTWPGPISYNPPPMSLALFRTCRQPPARGFCGRAPGASNSSG